MIGSHSRSQGTKSQHLIILVIYGILLFIGIAHHEMWMDESHHWLVARESTSLASLLDNYKYDGHPILWVVMMYGCSLVTESPTLIQYLHGMISLLAVGIFLFQAPFSRYFKYGIALGYYPLYEYGVISRNYSLLMLFLFCLPYCIQVAAKRPSLTWIVLGIIANTHLFGLVFSAVFGLYYFYTTYIVNSERQSRSGLGIGVFIVSLLFSTWTILPPSDHPSLEISLFFLSFSKIADTVMLLFKALIPLPDITSRWPWGTNLLTSQLKWIVAPIAIISWAIPLAYQWTSRRLIVLWYLTALPLAVFFAITSLHSGLRYSGVFLLFLLTLKWIDSNLPSQLDQSPRGQPMKKMTFTITAFIVSSHLLAGLYLLAVDIHKPFSSTQVIYNDLRSMDYHRLPITSNAYCNCISIENYHERPLYFLNIGRAMKFCQWDQLVKAKGMKNQYDLSKSIDKTLAYLESEGSAKSILLYHGDDIFAPDFLDNAALNSQKVTHLKTYHQGIVKRENFAVFLVER